MSKDIKNMTVWFSTCRFPKRENIKPPEIHSLRAFSTG
jgi:hypothetical protein